MYIQEQWAYFFNGNPDAVLYKEPETWNVVSHINKRYSYGKSLRFSDRFYRNWAIQQGKEDDEKFEQRKQEYASNPEQWRP